MNFSSGDWYYEHIYYSTLKQSLQTGQMPYHLSAPPDGRRSDRFLGLPNVLLSPQFVFLKWLPIPVFTLVNVLLLYSIGYLGCLSIRRRYQLAIGPFAFLFLLFNFNGFITAHLGIGHAHFQGYFLLSWYVLLILQMIENPNRYATPLAFPLVLAGIAYQGSFHIYVWCCAFLLAVGLCNLRYIRQVSLALLLSAITCSCRILPAMIALYGFKDFFHPGYADIRELIDA
ncbi:MAG: hypothetical protein JOZ57_05305, partial [Abitibacteriaceae bacterium]|nr:hypothetical protein [Abditibacteriaceae bacterium]